MDIDIELVNGGCKATYNWGIWCYVSCWVYGRYIATVSGFSELFTGWWFQPLWNYMNSSVGIILPNIWKNEIHVPNHQPDIIIYNSQYIYIYTLWLFKIFVHMCHAKNMESMEYAHPSHGNNNNVLGPWVKFIGFKYIILMSCVAWPIKPLLVQLQISCNANGLAVANPIGRAMI